MIKEFLKASMGLFSCYHAKTRTLLALFWALFLFNCGSEQERRGDQRIQGRVFGAEYEIRSRKGVSPLTRDSLIAIMDRIANAASTLRSNSLLDRFNSSEAGIPLNGRKGRYLQALFRWSKELRRSSNGAFDPTVAPLVSFWRGSDERMRTSGEELKGSIDSLMAIVGLEKVRITDTNGRSFLKKEEPRVQLDLSGLIKGFAMDRMREFLRSKGHEHFLFRIGDKYELQGRFSDGQRWKVPIGYPTRTLKDQRVSWLHIDRDTAAVVTSGNFQEFYTKNGRKYSYTIDPKTGSPTENRLLSVTVICENAVMADAMATAYMVMGTERAMQHASDHSSFMAFFISTDKNGEIRTQSSEGLRFSRADHSMNATTAN